MQLAELFRAVATIAQNGAPTRQCEALAREAENLADMVGWANGPIDPQGDWLSRLAALQDDLQIRHAQSGDAALVALNESLSRLGQAIARHDTDLEGDDDRTDDGEDFS